MTLAFMIMSSMTMMTLNICSVRIVIKGSPDGKSGTPTFLKSVVCYTHKCDFEKKGKFNKTNFQNKNGQYCPSEGAYECPHVLIKINKL